MLYAKNYHADNITMFYHLFLMYKEKKLKCIYLLYKFKVAFTFLLELLKLQANS